MSVPSSVPSDVRQGARASLRAVRRSVGAMDRNRVGALVAAVAMLVVLGCPWYRVAASARGADGSRLVLHQSLSGWQALSLPAVVAGLVAIAVIGLLLVRTGATVDGLGARARRAARARLDGRLIGGAGALVGLFAAVGLAVHPGPPAAVPGATAAVSAGFGLVLGLLDALVLAALGARISLCADGPRTPGAPSARPGPRRPRRRGATRHHGRGRVTADDDVPQFDFVLDRGSR